MEGILSEVSITDLYMHDAIEAGFRLEISRLREFYEAATAPKVHISCIHEWDCPAIHTGERGGPCSCEAAERKDRLNKAKAALAEAHA